MDTPRRGFLVTGLAAIAGAILGKKTAAADEPKAQPPRTMTAEGEPLSSHMTKGRPPVEPLDTMLLFERSDNNTERAMTHEILSLIHEEKGNKSYPWTIYAHLTTSHVEGDACVMCSRLTKKEPGWSSGLHSEVFNHARGVSLGVNIEMSNEYAGTEPTQIYGINVMAAHGKPCDIGIHIHNADSYWKRGIVFEGKGETGVDMAADYEVGINMRGNSIRLDEGSCIELDGAGKIKLRYKADRIEFLNGGKCVGHILVDGKDHAI